MKGRVTTLVCDTRIADIFHKACELHFFLLCGITVMHRCCGVYDLCSLHVAAALPNLLFILCACQGLCAHVLLPSVCGDGGATRVRDRSERDAWANPPRAPRCCLLSPTLCWVDGIHPPSLWRSSCIWCATNTVPSHCVGESLVVASIHDCAYCLSFSLFIPLSFVGQYSALTQSNQENKEKQCLQSKT
ncbi:putative retrotransposon hot spot protein (RHS) [Trypanosoma cruzi]|uniref:Putative retrotransposon hot spot protein (RHS) n=1 Tax=Trypanosoma cruzi TaxID=5693 RepID=A0A2V2X6X9_TRYCR|nr:putative retrotransposon hot spot protein (RHS) [Trypanosoma cruzi]